MRERKREGARTRGGENIRGKRREKKRNKGRFMTFAVANGVSDATVDAPKVPNATEWLTTVCALYHILARTPLHRPLQAIIAVYENGSSVF